jgi:hypothetical protein
VKVRKIIVSSRSSGPRQARAGRRALHGCRIVTNARPSHRGSRATRRATVAVSGVGAVLRCQWPQASTSVMRE